MPIGPRDIDLDPKAALRDFEHIANHVDAFPQIETVANKLGPQPGIGRLAQRIAADLNKPTAEVRELLRGLLSLRASAQFFRTPVAEFIDIVTDRLAEKLTTEEERASLKTWKGKKGQIAAAVESLRPDDAFLGSEKAGRLTFAHQNILKDVLILTDLRPVFNEEANMVKQAIVTHSLLIDYHDGADTRRIEMTLDAGDLSTLKRLCIRAEQKAVILKESLKATAWQTSIFNEWFFDPPERSEGAG
jgi:hypothetical protein